MWQGREPGQKSSSCISAALLGIKQGQKPNEARKVGGGQVLGGPAGQDTGLDLNLLGRGQFGQVLRKWCSQTRNLDNQLVGGVCSNPGDR